MKPTLALACLALCLFASQAQAAFVSLEASDNATVQPGGPRAGASGKAFFNIEGSNNGNFASFGVADFNLGLLPVLPGPILGVSLQMTQSNAGFSMTAPMTIYLSPQTTVDIQPGTSPLMYVAGMDGAASIDADLAPLAQIGAGVYTPISNGTVDTFPLVFDANALAILGSALANGTTVRGVISPDIATAAATYAGVTNTTFAGPTLVFEVLPEPGGAALIAVAFAAIAGARRRTWAGLSGAEGVLPA